MNPTSISIALVTRNNPHSLRRCLESVRSQEPQPLEIVVSDDSSPEFAGPTREAAEAFGCRYVPGPRRGLYPNRNCAALACQGTHIRTMDDDHIFPANHFLNCWRVVQGDPEAIWTTGEIFYLNGTFINQSERGIQLHPAGVGELIRDPDNNWGIADGSTMYPASVFRRGFRMMEDYMYGSSYLEFGALLYHWGYRSRCVPGEMVEHHGAEATLTRGKEGFMRESQWVASMAFNLLFRPHAGLLARYFLSHLLLNRSSPRVIGRMPRLIARLRRRWQEPLLAASARLQK